MQLSIGAKLLLGIIFIVLILGTFGLYLANTLTNVRHSFSELDTRYNALKEITSVENVNAIQADATKSYILTGDVAWVSVYDSASLEFDLRTESLDTLLSNGEDLENLHLFIDTSNRLRAQELLILSKVRSGEKDRAEEIFASDYLALQLESVEFLSLLRADMENSVSEIIQQNRVLILFSENILIAFMVILIVLITIVSLGVSFSVSSSIRELSLTVDAIIAGDLGRRARVRSSDEIGQLAVAFNKMTQKLVDSYTGLEKKVEEKTALLQENVGELEDSKLALENVMEDLEDEKDHLAISKARDEAIMESIGDGMFVLDRSGKILFLNKAAAGMFGCVMNQCLSKHISEMVTVYDGNGKVLAKDLWPFTRALERHEKVSTSDYSYGNKDEDPFAVSITANPILFNGESIGVVVIFRDITHEKEVDRAKTEFVSLASHQLRGPLTSIKWNAELLLEDETLTKDQHDSLNDLHESNDHMIELVSKLLNISRIEKGTYTVEPVRSDLREIADSLLSEYKPQMVEKNVTAIRDYPKVFAPMNVDPNLTRIMFQNLISNAIKYSRDGGQIKVSFEKSDDQVVFSVQDAGIGIPKNQHAHIFEKMFRASNAVDEQIHGNGLGLYMVKQIAEKAGGAISFESEEGKGTTFHVSIPITGMKQRKGTKTLT